MNKLLLCTLTALLAMLSSISPTVQASHDVSNITAHSNGLKAISANNPGSINVLFTDPAVAGTITHTVTSQLHPGDSGFTLILNFTDLHPVQTPGQPIELGGIVNYDATSGVIVSSEITMTGQVVFVMAGKDIRVTFNMIDGRYQTSQGVTFTGGTITTEVDNRDGNGFQPFSTENITPSDPKLFTANLAGGHAVPGSQNTHGLLLPESINPPKSAEATERALPGIWDTAFASPSFNSSVGTLKMLGGFKMGVYFGGKLLVQPNIKQGSTLNANSITDPDGVPATISYQWRADGAPIQGATSDTYVVTHNEVGKTIDVTAEYTDNLGNNESISSGSTRPIENINDLPTGTVVLDGDTTEGEYLMANTSSLSDLDGLGTFAYQWQVNGMDVAGATDDRFLLAQSHVGKNVSVTVRYTDGYGANEAVSSAASAAVGNVAPSWLNIPTQAQIVPMNSDVDLADIAVDELDNTLTVTLTTTHGTIGGLTDADSNSPGIQLIGQKGDINRQLADATFAHAENSVVDITITVEATDGLETATANYPLRTRSILTFTDVIHNEDAGILTFNGTLSGTVPDGFKLLYVTQGITAQSNQDFTPASGEINHDGNTSTPITIDVPVIDDVLFEPNEQLTLSFGSIDCNTETSCPVLLQTATATIVDDDGPQQGLSVFITNKQSDLSPGDKVTYTISVLNSGVTAFSVPVSALMPANNELLDVTWRCSANQGGTCSASDGSGDVNTQVTLANRAQATIIVEATVGEFNPTLDVTASITPPAGYVDPDSSDNTATDSDLRTVIFGGDAGGFEASTP